MREPKLATDRSAEGIAIIGMAGRFPGARNIDEFWQNLRNGVESVTFFSDQELEASGVDPANFRNPNYIKAGAILEDVGLFDADFFEITARDAACLDPQHRLLLECAWETLEHAGYSPSSYTGTIGVYAGSRISEYLMFNLPTPDLAGFNVESGPLVTNWKRVWDNDKDQLATRVAYTLNLRGPAITVQTACSTSLVAVHLACQSLLREECDIILAGGVCVRVPQKAGYLYSEGMIFSPDGHTRAFDAKGGGTIFSSGVGMVALKPLHRALADGDCIQAVIKGSAVNNDGDAMKVAFTAPSVDGQEEAVSKALSVAKIDPGSISYVEANGTATAQGDFTEMSALTKAFRSGTDRKGSCALGSVKTNIGHSVQAEGVIGMIKTVLMLKHKMLVPHLHFEEPNPEIDFLNCPFYVNTELTEWNSETSPRRAGVSSFGVGGTNAHVVLEEGPVVERTRMERDRPTHILCLSAKNEGALKGLINSYEKFFATYPETPVGNVCFTANSGRSHFSHRLAVIAGSSAAMEEKLSSICCKDEPEDIPDMRVVGSDRPMIAFLFSGQGSQYIDMGRQLFDTQPRFRKTMEKCDRILRPYMNRPLLSVLYSDRGSERSYRESGGAEQASRNLNQTLYAQTSLFALEYSLFELWKSWGVEPDVVMGHSIGEYVAACVAGIFDLKDGLRLVAERGRLMQELPGDGAMAAVFADEMLVKDFIEGYSERVSIAAFNGPRNVVVSGNEEGVQAVLEDLEREGIEGRRLTVSNAFHSPAVQPILDKFEQIAAEVNYSDPEINLISSVTGQVVERREVSCASYWRRHMREPVMFASSMGKLAELGCNTCVELGPGSTLLGMGRLCMEEDDGVWLPSLNRGRDDWTQMLRSLGALYAMGTVVDWAGFDRDYSRRRVALPTYPFQQKRHWIERSESQNGLRRKEHSRFTHLPLSCHPLLGQRLPSALREIQFESRLNIGATTFLQDHHAFGAVIFPATAFIEMVLAAASEISIERGTYVVEDLEIHEALTLPQDDSKVTQLILTPEDGYGFSFRIFSLVADGLGDSDLWKINVAGRLRTEAPGSSLQKISLESIREQCGEELSVARFYLKSEERGITHGPDFQAVEKLRRGNGQAIALIRLSDSQSIDAEDYQIHPVLLDACLHIGNASFPEYDEETKEEEIFLPTIFEHIHVYGKPGTRLWSYTVLRPGDHAESELRTIDIYIFNLDGNLVAEVQGLHFKRATRESLLGISNSKTYSNWLYEVRWKAIPLAVTEAVDQDQDGIWLIFADRNSVGSELVRTLCTYGESCITIFPGECSETIENDEFYLNPMLPEDFRKLLSCVRTLPGTLQGVVHLWGLEMSATEDGRGNSCMDAPILDCASGLHLIQALVKEKDLGLPSLWFVTRGAQALLHEDPPLAVEHSALWGLGRVAGREYPKLRCGLIDLDPGRQGDEDAMLFKELWSPDIEDQIGFRKQVRYVSRLVRVTGAAYTEAKLEIPDTPYFRLETSPSCILNNLSLRAMERREPGPGEIEICVRATGLNFRDVLSALGRYPGDPGPLGRECSGTIVAVGDGVEGLRIGDDVLAVAAGSFSSYVIANAHRVMLKPDFLSFEDASSIPITFLTAYYGLYHLSKISAGEKVLIHAASGGVGLAATQLVNWAGAEVLATASVSKWEFLRSFGVKEIMNSRTLDFANDVMAITDGRGVDVVLNSLAGDFIPKSLSVLGKEGRFIEIGKTRIWNASQVAELRPDVTYFAFDLGDVALREPLFFQSMFRKVMDGFREGPLAPLPQKRYTIEGSISAFRYMAQAKHIGKIVVSQQNRTNDVLRKESGILLSNGSYLITGGLGALGLRIASWLVSQNARHIVLMGRRDPSDHAREVIRKLEKDGAQVHVAQADVSKREQVAEILKDISECMPPLRGLIHAAGVLDDGVLMQQTWERFVTVMTPKVAGAWNLHLLTKEIPLDFFVLFSSVSSLWGTPGQGNYSAANAFLDGLAHLRSAKRLPCVSINWGSWAEIGMAAALDDNIQQRRKSTGLGTIELENGLEILGRLMCGESVEIAVLNVNWEEYLQQFSDGIVPPFLSEMLKVKGKHAREDRVQRSEEPRLLQKVKEAPQGEREQIVAKYVRKEMAELLGIDPGKTLDPQKPFRELGLDSLSAIELRNAFEASLGCTLPATLLYEYPTLDTVSSHLAEKLIPEEANTGAQVESFQNGDHANKKSGESFVVPNQYEVPPPNVRRPEALRNEDLKSMVPIHTNGSLLPFFIVHISPLSIHLRLGPEQPIYYFRAL